MLAGLDIEVISAEEIGASERAAWAAFRAADARYASPYFDLRYVAVAASVAPDAQIAVLHRGGVIVGFLPFQRRGGAILPLGAPMTDYHGLLPAPGETFDLGRIVSGLEARSFRFTGLVTAGAKGSARLYAHRTVVADLSQGFDAWLADRQARHPRFFKGRRRNQRAIEREIGPLAFSWSREEHGVLDYVIALKRAQYRRTRQHDIFGCGWTERMLRALLDASEPDFGLGFASLRAGGSMVAAEAALLSGTGYHLWLPVYELAYARYGPGNLMTLETLRALAAAGVTRIDFGRDDADYKRYFADPAETVLEGAVIGEAAPLARLAERALAAGSPSGLTALHARARRRLDVITACETSHWRRACGAALALGLAAQGMAPLARTNHQPTPRRPDVHRAYSRLDTPADERFSQGADDLRAPAA
jgi:CelD/BcsL family acetyltransferase involved in cellulose biosynthesis